MEHVKLNYVEFVSELRRQLYQIIPVDMEMEVHHVLKNNSVCLDSLILKGGGCNVSPDFHLRDYYYRYENGNEIAMLAEDIYQKWQELADAKDSVIPDLTYDNCRQFIVYRLINAGRNRELLEEVPHIPFFDLAITFHCLIDSQEDGIKSIRISNQLMECWGVNTRILLQMAGENTPRLFPAKYCPFQEVLQDIITPSQEQNNLTGQNQPWVLTNQKGINGAAAWLYPHQLEEMSQKHQKNFYILPSSIHELIIIVQEDDWQEEKLLEMVRQVNQECVNEEEFLSDNIYLYNYQKRGIKMIHGFTSEDKSINIEV